MEEWRSGSDKTLFYLYNLSCFSLCPEKRGGSFFISLPFALFFCLAGFNFSAFFLPVKVRRIGNEVKFIPNSQQRRETSLFEGIWTMVVVETVCDSSLLFSYVGGQNM